jgi:hypothetical protein
MPILKCPRCGVTQYVPPPYLRDAECVECELQIAPARGFRRSEGEDTTAAGRSIGGTTSPGEASERTLG